MKTIFLVLGALFFVQVSVACTDATLTIEGFAAEDSVVYYASGKISRIYEFRKDRVVKLTFYKDNEDNSINSITAGNFTNDTVVQKGKHVSYYPNGDIRSKGKILADKFHGSCISF